MLNVMEQRGSERLVLEAFKQMLPTPGDPFPQVAVVACRRGRHRAVSIGELAALWRNHLVGPTEVRHLGDWAPADASAEIARIMTWLGEPAQWEEYEPPLAWSELHEPLWPGVRGLANEAWNRYSNAYEEAVELVAGSRKAQEAADKAAVTEESRSPAVQAKSAATARLSPRQEAADQPAATDAVKSLGAQAKSAPRKPQSPRQETASRQTQPQIPQSPTRPPHPGKKRPRSPSRERDDRDDRNPCPSMPHQRQRDNRRSESRAHRNVRKARSWQGGEQPRQEAADSDSDCVAPNVYRPEPMSRYPNLARADAIMAEKDVSRKAAERFWGMLEELGNGKNGWWNMDDIMRKLNGFWPNKPSEWLTQAIYDRLVEQVPDFASCARQVPSKFMEHTQWDQEMRRLALRQRWQQF